MICYKLFHPKIVRITKSRRCRKTKFKRQKKEAFQEWNDFQFVVIPSIREFGFFENWIKLKLKRRRKKIRFAYNSRPNTTITRMWMRKFNFASCSTESWKNNFFALSAISLTSLFSLSILGGNFIFRVISVSLSVCDFTGCNLKAEYFEFCLPLVNFRTTLKVFLNLLKWNNF